jgi:hypothetical protein
LSDTVKSIREDPAKGTPRRPGPAAIFQAFERIRGKGNASLIRRSAPSKVDEVPERPRTLGLVPATVGYTGRDYWEEIADVQSKPNVAAELFASRYQAGFTHLEHLAAPRRASTC